MIYPLIFVSPFLNLYIQIFICEDAIDIDKDLIRDCDAFYYPFVCLFTCVMMVLVVCLAMLFVCTSFENFFKNDVLARIPTQIDYDLIYLRIFIDVSDLFI